MKETGSALDAPHAGPRTRVFDLHTALPVLFVALLLRRTDCLLFKKNGAFLEVMIVNAEAGLFTASELTQAGIRSRRGGDVLYSRAAA